MDRNDSQERRRQENDQVLIVLLGIVAAAALPALMIGALFWVWAKPAFARSPLARVAIVLLVLGCAAGLYLLRGTYIDLLMSLQDIIRSKAWADLQPLTMRSWLVTVPAAPMLGILVHLMIPSTTDEQIKRQGEQQQAQLTRQQRRAARQVRQAPTQVQGDLVLGACITGDLQQCQRGTWMTYPAWLLAQHAVVIGASGSGKTETLLRLAQLAVQVYGWQVVYLDAKGDRPTAARFLSAMQKAGCGNALLFPTHGYDGWRGDARALLNRLHAVQSFSEPYYADVATVVLSLALNAPAGIPRSSTQLLQRLDREVLRELYNGHPQSYQVERLRADDVRGVYQRYAGFFSAVGRQIDGGWTLEDVDAAYLLLDGTALKHEAASLGRWLVEELAHYLTVRKSPERRVLVLIDEFSAISMVDAANLFERIRSFGAGVVVGSQSYAGLGLDAERLLGAAASIILHRCSDPEQLIRRAGTVASVDYSYQLDERGQAGQRILRQQQRLRVDPNEVRQLQPGESFFITGGRAARLQVAQLGVDEAGGQLLLERGGWQTSFVEQQRLSSQHALQSTASGDRSVGATRHQQGVATQLPVHETRATTATVQAEETGDDQQLEF